MDMADYPTPMVLGVVAVVEESEDGLQTEQGDDNGSKAGVGLLEELERWSAHG